MERHTALLKDSSLCRRLSRLDISLGKGTPFKIRTVLLQDFDVSQDCVTFITEMNQ